MPAVSTEVLQGTIRNLYRCESTWVQAVPVTETFHGETVWDGEVQVFDLIDFTEAQRAYAWSFEVTRADGGGSPSYPASRL